MLREEPLRRAVVHPVIACAVRVMVPAGVAAGTSRRRRAASSSGPPPWQAHAAMRRLERDPALVAVLARERVLDVAQARLRRRVRPGARSVARARRGSSARSAFEPALRFLLEIVDGAHETPSFR